MSGNQSCSIRPTGPTDTESVEAAKARGMEEGMEEGMEGWTEPD